MCTPACFSYRAIIVVPERHNPFFLLKLMCMWLSEHYQMFCLPEKERRIETNIRGKVK